MSALVSGLIGAVLAFGLVALAKRTRRPATVSPDGWRMLRPGWLLDATILGCAAFAALAGYFLLSGGSSRPDAATQNGFAMLLVAAFTVGALYTAWTSYGRTIMWQGNALRVRPLWGSESVRRLSDAVKVQRSEVLGEYRIAFRDGSRLSLSLYLHGTDELIAKLPRGAFRD